ncbi:hypothetical protein [Halobacillus massiliensis]|uniref:hypothetical protein n=1 Tax=Halobacillus massiliensis TaxID=1926286 RepID=UPI0009E35E88|nr:hypothetical protein [Halobacillus massiliensis]
MNYKVIASNGSNVSVEFAINKKELVFPTFEEAEQFAQQVQETSQWFENYNFTVIMDDDES